MVLNQKRKEDPMARQELEADAIDLCQEMIRIL